MSDQQPPQQTGLAPVPDPPITQAQPDKAKPHRLARRPHDDRGVYRVLAAPNHDPLQYVELGWYRGSSQASVKRQVVEDAEAGHLGDVKGWLEDRGVWLRPVPAESWPKNAEPTRYERPAPKLRIG